MAQKEYFIGIVEVTETLRYGNFEERQMALKKLKEKDPDLNYLLSEI